jgi:hypothetical protein
MTVERQNVARMGGWTPLPRPINTAEPIEAFLAANKYSWYGSGGGASSTTSSTASWTVSTTGGGGGV